MGVFFNLLPLFFCFVLSIHPPKPSKLNVYEEFVLVLLYLF